MVVVRLEVVYVEDYGADFFGFQDFHVALLMHDSKLLYHILRIFASAKAHIATQYF